MATILLLGSGGRESALAWRLTRETSPKNSPKDNPTNTPEKNSENSPTNTPEKNSENNRILAAPGNPYIKMLGGECLTPAASTNQVLVELALAHKPDLVIAGSEEPLANGIADEMAKAGILCLGPNKSEARLEASKSFARNFCQAHQIPSPWYKVVTSTAQAETAIADAPTTKFAVKADGLCGGKGVILCYSKAEALKAAQGFLEPSQPPQKTAHTTLVLEELLEGEELSFFALVSNSKALPLGSGRDYKRLTASPTAPNTGGMGCFSTKQLCPPTLQSQIMEKVVLPLAKAMPNYRGVLFVGLMLTKQGIKVLEFNVRFGDPECQVLMARLEGNLANALTATAKGELPPANQLKLGNWAAVTVVMANRGYPTKPQTGELIPNLHKIKETDPSATTEGLRVFHSGTSQDAKGNILATGGRVLNVTATSPKGLATATQNAYEAVQQLRWKTAVWRNDIAT